MGRPILHTVEVLTKILDSQCSNPSVAVACARAHCSPASFWNWRLLSSNGDPAFILEYLGIEAQFASHLRLCRDIFMSSVEAAALARAERGTYELCFHQGHPVFAMNHKFEGWSDDDMTTLGYDPVEDRYAHTDTGERIQNRIWHPAPIELVKASLQAYSKRWAAQSHIDIDQRTSLGVSIVGGEKLKALDVTPKAAQVEHVGKPTEVEGVFEELRPPDVAATSRPDPSSLAANDHPEPCSLAANDHPEPTDVAAPVAPHDDPNNPITQDTRAREAARAASLATGIKPPVAPLLLPVEMRPDPDRDLPDDGSTPTKPAPPTMDTVAERIHAIKKKVRDNVPLSAIERQVAAALKRGDERGARILLGYRASPDREGIGEGRVAPGGAAIATTARGAMKMV